MKKSTLVSMFLGAVSVGLFGVGMCMTMLTQWDAFNLGIITGCAGLLLGLITITIWRKMEKLPPIKFTGRTAVTVLLGIVGTLGLGVGMCLVMLWGNLIVGIVIGMVGIMLLLSLFPLCKGIK